MNGVIVMPRAGRGHIGGQAQDGGVGVVKGRSQLQLIGVPKAAALGDVGEVAVRGKRGAGHYDALLARKEQLVKLVCDVQRGGVQRKFAAAGG